MISDPARTFVLTLHSIICSFFLQATEVTYIMLFAYEVTCIMFVDRNLSVWLPTVFGAAVPSKKVD